MRSRLFVEIFDSNEVGPVTRPGANPDDAPQSSASCAAFLTR